MFVLTRKGCVAEFVSNEHIHGGRLPNVLPMCAQNGSLSKSLAAAQVWDLAMHTLPRGELALALPKGFRNPLVRVSVRVGVGVGVYEIKDFREISYPYQVVIKDRPDGYTRYFGILIRTRQELSGDPLLG